VGSWGRMEGKMSRREDGQAEVWMREGGRSLYSEQGSRQEGVPEQKLCPQGEG
jgi:hypothetical protein